MADDQQGSPSARLAASRLQRSRQRVASPPERSRQRVASPPAGASMKVPPAGVCAACNGNLDYGEVVHALGGSWHRMCFMCVSCRQIIAAGAPLMQQQGLPCCMPCWEEHFADRCAACKKPIGAGARAITLQDRSGRQYHSDCFVCSACRSPLKDDVLPANGALNCRPCWMKLHAERCDGCGKPFNPGGRYVTCGARQLHPACFCCEGCGAALADGTYVPHGDCAMCGDCDAERNAPRCARCSQPIRGRFIEFGGQTLHAACFTCDECGAALADAKHVPRSAGAVCVACERENHAPHCAACGRPIEGDFVSTVGEGGVEHTRHKGCFTCTQCSTQLGGPKPWYQHGGSLYCATHFRERQGRVCTICGARLLEWVSNAFGEVSCTTHSNLPTCHGCCRWVAEGAPGTRTLADGRAACARCAAIAVDAQPDAADLLSRVRAFLRTALGMAADGEPTAKEEPCWRDGTVFYLPAADDIPLRLLDRPSLLRRNAHAMTRSLHAEHACPLGLTSTKELTRTIRGSGEHVPMRTRERMAPHMPRAVCESRWNVFPNATRGPTVPVCLTPRGPSSPHAHVPSLDALSLDPRPPRIPTTARPAP